MKQIYIEILSEENRILIKELAATYRVKNTFLINNKFIQRCHNNWADEHLEVKRTENFIW